MGPARKQAPPLAHGSEQETLQMATAFWVLARQGYLDRLMAEVGRQLLPMFTREEEEREEQREAPRRSMPPEKKFP